MSYGAADFTLNTSMVDSLTEFDGCTDYNPDCYLWSMQGECDVNPGFMYYNCSRQCKVGCQARIRRKYTRPRKVDWSEPLCDIITQRFERIERKSKHNSFIKLLASDIFIDTVFEITFNKFREKTECDLSDGNIDCLGFINEIDDGLQAVKHFVNYYLYSISYFEAVDGDIDLYELWDMVATNDFIQITSILSELSKLVSCGVDIKSSIPQIWNDVYCVSTYDQRQFVAVGNCSFDCDGNCSGDDECTVMLNENVTICTDPSYPADDILSEYHIEKEESCLISLDGQIIYDLVCQYYQGNCTDSAICSVFPNEDQIDDANVPDSNKLDFGEGTCDLESNEYTNNDGFLIAPNPATVQSSRRLFGVPTPTSNQRRLGNMIKKNDEGPKGQDQRWPFGVIPYEIDPLMPPNHMIVIGQAIAIWNKETVVDIIDRTEPGFSEPWPQNPGWIYFFFGQPNPDTDYPVADGHTGCWSYVGKLQGGGKQDLSLGHGCDRVDIALHEIGHALGMYHEHQRTDRAPFIDIDYNNIKPGAEKEFNLQKDAQLCSTYDFNSIMHYGPIAFAVNTSIPVITRDDGEPLIEAKQLSDLDIECINEWYSFPTPSPTTDPTRSPTTDPTRSPSVDPTQSPSTNPTRSPSTDPTDSPTTDPVHSQSTNPTHSPTIDPTQSPSTDPTRFPTTDPTAYPTADPTHSPTTDPTADPTAYPTLQPTNTTIDVICLVCVHGLKNDPLDILIPFHQDACIRQIFSGTKGLRFLSHVHYWPPDYNGHTLPVMKAVHLNGNLERGIVKRVITRICMAMGQCDGTSANLDFVCQGWTGCYNAMLVVGSALDGLSPKGIKHYKDKKICKVDVLCESMILMSEQERIECEAYKQWFEQQQAQMGPIWKQKMESIEGKSMNVRFIGRILKRPKPIPGTIKAIWNPANPAIFNAPATEIIHTVYDFSLGANAHRPGRLGQKSRNADILLRQMAIAHFVPIGQRANHAYIAPRDRRRERILFTRRELVRCREF